MAKSDLRNAIWDALRAGDLEIVDKDDNPREAHSASEINLSSDIQRLRIRAHEHQDTPASNPEDDPPTNQEGEERRPDSEKRLTISTVLAVDAENRDAIRVMLDALRNSIQDGDLTWLQLQLSATLSPDAASSIETKAQNSGMNATIADQ